MLPNNFLDSISNQAVSLYGDLELKIIKEIAIRISNVGYANTVVLNNTLIAQEMGMLYQDIITLVATETGKTEAEIIRIFQEAGTKTLVYDDKIYKEAGLNPIPIKQSKNMLQFLTSTVKKTNGNLKNLMMTTADTSQTSFYNSINQAYMEVSTGTKSYSQAIVDAISKVSKDGATIKYPSGRNISMETAVRTNIVTSVNQTCGKLQEMRAEELDWDLMEITAHGGSRPEHAKWQGKIVSRSGKDGYLTLNDIGYGSATGFKGVNCKHDWRPYYEGSSLTYSKNELNDMKNETVTYQGKEIPKYDALQMQRKMETQIRQDKKDIVAINAILTSSDNEELRTQAKNKLIDLQTKQKIHTSQLNGFIKETELKKDNTRLKIN